MRPKQMDINILRLRVLEKILENLRAARAKSGFTQTYIADKLNVEHVTYGRWERGQTPVTVRDLLTICEILQIDLIDLFPHSEKVRPKSRIQVMLTLTDKNEIDIDLLNYIHQAIKKRN